MRKMEKKNFYERLTIKVGKLIDRLNLDGWLDMEIYEKTGMVSARISEAKNFKKYGRPITEKHLAALIGSGLIMIGDLMEVAKTNDEIQLVNDLGFYADKNQKAESNKLKELGVNPAESHTLARQLKEAGIDPIKAMAALLQEARKNKP